MCWSPSGKVRTSLFTAAGSTAAHRRSWRSALSAEQPSPQSLRRLEHEYSLAAELDPAWAAKPLALTRHEGRTILVLRTLAVSPWIGFLSGTRGNRSI